MKQSALNSELSRQQFNSIQSFLFLVILQVLLLFSLSITAIGQNIFPVAAPWETGIGSALIGTIPNQFPQKPLHLHTFPGFTRHTFAPPNDKNQSDAMQSFNSFSDIILEQNRPNPFEENTVISYFIPKKYNGMAKLIIANENGSEIFQNFEICNGKPCQLTISSKELQIGVYIYGIEINGRIVRANKMMVIK